LLVGPPELADRPAHRGHRHAHAALAFPRLAVLVQRGLWAGLQLLPQGAPLLGGLTDLQMLGVRPGEGLGATSPVSRLRLSQRRTVAKETPKVSTIRALGPPRSTAASTLALRSFE
jgi:hypothetical protein